MDMTLAGAVIVIVMLLMMLMGLEIALSMGLTSIIALFLILDKPLDTLAFTAFDVMNSFLLTAIPLFVFMGAILHHTGVVRKLFDGVDKWVSVLPGGVTHSVIVANAIFGAMSGSSVAATALFGRTCYPQLERLGYSYKISLGVIVSGGTLAVLIPPSVIMIVYGGWENVSVARLFAGGVIPGIILTLLFMITIIVRVKINPSLVPEPLKFTMREKLFSLLDILPFMILIVIMLGAIFGGYMTPTEAAALGALLSIIFALLYRQMSFKALKQSMWTAVNITAMIALISFTARVLSQVFQYVGVTDKATTFFLNLPGGRIGALVAIYIMYLILGCFFDSFSMLVLTLPFVSPVLSTLGYSQIWFGVVYVVLAEVGLLTPPFGLNLFVLHGVLPQYDIMKIVRSALPFFIPLLLVILLCTIFPEIVLWLPSKIYG